MIQIDIRPDGSEKVKYDFDGYFAYIRKGLLSRYADYAADSHWHDDLEFISVLSGQMDYNINGEILHLEAGQGVMVNARQLHYGFSSEKNECEFYCVLLHPVLLCATQSIDGDFIAAPYVFLDKRISWQGEILSDIEVIYQCRDKKNAPLHIQNAFYHIWILLTENVSNTHHSKKQDGNLSLLKEMLFYIQKHYGEHVTLDDIARSGNVSKSTCLSVFKKYLGDTPSNYLILYRLKKACKLLETTTLSITEIAFDVGFQSGSYFAEMYRRIYGCSPSSYRKKSGDH